MRKLAIVRNLGVSDVEQYRAIRLSALQTDPEAFGSVHAVEASRPLAAHAERLTSSLVFGAYIDMKIVGMVGLRRDDNPKDAHKGLMWGFYVEPDSRKHGVGVALISTLVGAAAGLVEQVMLSVVEQNSAAIALYERFGFVRYGLEPRAMKSERGYANEVLMIRFLQDASCGSS